MKHLILSIALFLYSSSFSIEAYSQGAGGDFYLINEDNSIIVEFEITCVSIPFEGLNNQLNGFAQYNRVGVQQNGSSGRIFESNTVTNYNGILRYKFEGGYHINFLGFLATADLQPPVNGKALPLGKFKITVKVQGTDEKYSLYFNNLDSKYGTGNWQGENIYGADWYVKLRADLPAYNRLAIHYAHGGQYVYDTVSSADTLANGEPSKEFKVWEILYDRDEPWEKNFYARTIPFPVKDSIINPSNGDTQYEYILGTTVTLDTIFPNLGANDKYGYNTIPTTDYYFNPVIDATERGNHTFTPGVISSVHWAYDRIFACKIIATTGDTLIISNDKHFWVNGTNTVHLGAIRGDTLIFETGSHLILNDDASLRAMKGGTIIDKGATKDFSSGSFVTVMANSKLIVDGLNVTYPANARIEIEANGYLILKDNSTLIFDGEGAHLEIHPDANLILGENSKIEFRNGAYLDADGITFSGDSGAIWGGLVFHNAGGQTQIKNCTFNDAKISIDIKNTTGCYADLEKRITGNTFNQPSIGSHSIRAENVFKLLLQGNTFNIAANKTGVEILNRINAGNSQEDGGN
ncbi:MAG: hypothetical protein UZ04_CHB001000375 [Chlorobi bacterium OLB4]|jgi:hypothetical protein|nr:MAG: hypothetical protein UZ04_CHB001000375 [Chlorobi bacterium OLB4]MBW7854736.1 hypothetical protein [Ignavibacteria bacterium]